MIGVEMVSDRKKKTAPGKEITRALFDECLKRGLMSMCYSNTIRINPPLIITRAEAEEGLGKLDEAMSVIEKRFGL
jgi:4-aminobutyrate aminotransferase-like enzyme